MVEVTYKTPDQLPIMEEVTENTYALVEENGTLKRVSGSNLGGSGGIKTVIIRSSDYVEALSGVASAGASVSISYECINTTFEEVYGILASGEPVIAMGQVVFEGMACITSATCIFATAFVGVPCIVIELFTVVNGTLVSGGDVLYWTADGLSVEAPNDNVK